MEHIASHHNDLVDAVVYRGGVATGDFGLRIGEKSGPYFCNIKLFKNVTKIDKSNCNYLLINFSTMIHVLRKHKDLVNIKTSKLKFSRIACTKLQLALR